MDFVAVVDQVITLLRQRGRVSWLTDVYWHVATDTRCTSTTQCATMRCWSGSLTP